MTLIRVAAPTSSPVTLAELKEFARVDHDEDDVQLSEFIEAATARLDGPSGLLGRAIMTQSWRLVLDSFPMRIKLPLPPVQSVTSITFLDSAGEERTLAPAAYTHADGTVTAPSWPDTAELPGAVSVTFVTGYGALSDIPDDLRHAIKALASDMFDGHDAAEARLGEVVARHREWAF